ncbi:MAG: penicillin-binding protein 2 [Parcubacteria group bacterium]
MFFPYIKRKFLKSRRKIEGDDFIFASSDISSANRKMKSKMQGSWVEGSFINYSDEELAKRNKNFLGLGMTPNRQRIFLCLVMLGLLVLFGRAVYLQAFLGQHYLGVAENNRIRVRNLPAPRGIIYDSRGVALSKNIPGFAVYIVPFDMMASVEKESDAIAWLNKNLGDEKIKDSLERIKSIGPYEKEYYEPVLLADDLEYAQAIVMRIDSVKYPGVAVEMAAKREYPAASADNRIISSLSHIIGYEGKISKDEYQKLGASGYLLNDFIGKTGIEASYESQLRGLYGKEEVEVDATGRTVKILAQENLRKGDNIYLSIDSEMQARLEGVMKSRMATIGKSKGVAIVENPNNGQILAMVSLPSFDSNDFAKGISRAKYDRLLSDDSKPLYNRAVSGEYPSGSIIKPVIATAALEEGVIKENTTFVSVGGVRIGQWFFPDWKAGGHGATNVRKALADSVNTFFYIVGGGYLDFPGLGVYKIKEYAEKFGLNKISGIELPNEKAGFLPTPEWKIAAKKEEWYIGDTYHEAIGQGDLLVTPLQVVNYACVFANRGTLYKPQIVMKYFSQEKNMEIEVQPSILNTNFVQQANLEVVRQGMRQAVTQGTAKILNALPVSAAAKTGTAQWQEGKNAHSWFAAFAPYEKPQIAIVVLVEEGGEGTAAAAPVAFEFMNWYFRTYKK